MMVRFIDISNRQQLLDAFSLLTAETIPLWGKMKPQQMVEHLIDQVEYTNGKKMPTLDVPEDEADASRERWIYTDLEIPKNVFLKTLTEDYIHPDLVSAVDQLMLDLALFDQHFKQPGLKVVHGGFGPMTYNEWLIWHGKHFTHHLKQFGLI